VSGHADVTAPAGSAPAGSGSAAEHLTRLLFQSTFVFWGHFVARAAELGLTPVQAHALMVLQPDRTLTMRELAAGLDCDASTVTGLADRLETHGLISRQAIAGDRRVRALALTQDGVLRRSQLLGRLARAPESVRALDRRVVARVSAGLERILAGELGSGAQSGGAIGGPHRAADVPDHPSDAVPQDSHVSPSES
jgi:DNA-binding MarR family transcriptional regulator